ncbi:MAG TPA: hypothetical protein VH331_17455 [Allosphingosinicella sp.]|jgi:hypothetical protein|nr:hypothetical protein [Allosphingosinicella sp.]
MTGPSSTPKRADPAGAAALMARHGITRSTVHQYLVDGYRYTSLVDALAQAKRRSGTSGDPA